MSAIKFDDRKKLAEIEESGGCHRRHT
jgi:hypothetical protein